MTQQKRLGWVLVLNLVMITGLVLVGLRSDSFSVLAAAGDFVADSAAILLGLIAIRISKDPRGNPKATSYVAFLNSLVLLTLTIFIIFGSVDRLAGHAQSVKGLPVLIVSAVAAGSMLIGTLILGAQAATEDLHMRSVWLDTVSDGVTSAVVAVSGLIIWRTNRFFWLDSALAIVIGLVICFTALDLLLKTLKSLRSDENIPFKPFKG